MRFIRDIIAEKSQAAGQADGAALRYPLRLREQDRADVSEEPTPTVHIEAEPAAPVPEPAVFVAPQPPEPAEATVDLSAISAALKTAPLEEPVQQEELQPEASSDPFGNLFAEEAPQNTSKTQLVVAPQWADPDEAVAPQVAAPPPIEEPATSPKPQPEPAQVAPPPTESEVDLAALQANMAAAKPAAGRGSKGRVKTRLLGFSAPASQAHDPMAQSGGAPTSAQAQFPVGWLVVVDGPGKGASFSLHDGLTQIGRGEGQTVRLDFGDTTISRENHAAIAFDGEQRRFFFGHGGKANLVRLNGRPVLSTEDLDSNSLIRIGETTLRFVALCGADFAWDDGETGHGDLG